MKQIDDCETITKVLLSAGSLFSKSGYHGTSIRDVTKHAGVNLAAINYHFGDKENLYREIIIRRLRPINRLRLDQLERVLTNAGDGPVPLSTIIDIFARPFFAPMNDSESGESHMVLLIARSLIEPLPFVDELLAKELHPITMRFSQAIRRHMPSLTPAEFMWRLSFVIGSMHHALATMPRMTDLTRGLCESRDSAGALRHFIHFAVISLSAPVTPSAQ